MNLRNLMIWGIVLLVLLALFNLLQGPREAATSSEITYSQFLDQVESGAISSVTIRGDRVDATGIDGQAVRTTLPAQDTQITGLLRENNVNINVQRPESGNTLLNILIGWFPMLLLIGVWIFFMRQMQSGGRGAMGFGKSKARLLTERQGRVTFDDVAGVDEAKEELQEIVEFLKDPSKFQRLGGRIPKGALLIGPPGTGKTLIARAVAGEANVPFFTISGSDFVEMFVGVGASRVRDMFEQAKKNAPCIIFIDEIDAVGRSRGAGLGGGNDEREQTLNQLLVEMDGFEANEGVILIAATNRPDVLDPALLRPGRFDRQVVVPNPDIIGREKILKVHMRNVPISGDVEAKVIARGTPGFSGADLANLVNEAALLAARRNKRVVSMSEFEEAKDKVMMGPERRSMVMSDEEKQLTAYHEAGHAIVALNMKGSDPVHKATIIPRGRALGMVAYLPESDKYSYTLQQMKARLAMAMGGRVAEELKFGKEMVTSGASSDIQMATRLAKAMVARWGLSEKMGPIAYADDSGEVFLGQQIVRASSTSPDTSRQIEEEVKRFVYDGHETARQILIEKTKDWETLAQGLLEFETLSGEEINDLLKGKKPVRETDEPPASGKPSSAVPTTDEPVAEKKPRARKKPGSGLEPDPAGA